MQEESIIIKPWVTPFYALLGGYLLLLALLAGLLCWYDVPSGALLNGLIAIGCFLVILTLFSLIHMLLLFNTRYILGQRVIEETMFGRIVDKVDLAKCAPQRHRFLFWEDILLMKEYFWFNRGGPTWTSLKFLKPTLAAELYEEISRRIEACE